MMEDRRYEVLLTDGTLLVDSPGALRLKIFPVQGDRLPAGVAVLDASRPTEFDFYPMHMVRKISGRFQESLADGIKRWVDEPLDDQ